MQDRRLPSLSATEHIYPESYGHIRQKNSFANYLNIIKIHHIIVGPRYEGSEVMLKLYNRDMKLNLGRKPDSTILLACR